MAAFTLKQFLLHAADTENAGLQLRAAGSVPLPFLEALKKLDRLDLLRDDVIMGLVGQAPIDPIGLYGAMRTMGVWAFNVFDFTMVQVLAKKGEVPVALMRLDLLSDDLVFVVLKDGKLVEHSQVSADRMMAQMREPGMTESGLKAWLTDRIREAVKVGRGDAD